MRKKFLLMLTLLILALGGSGKLFAANGNVAKVGNTEYATIDEAIANWTNNSTLTLLSDVTLSDVVTLNSTEHHILNLGTYTMTAASGKNAFVIKACGTGDAERTAITIKADATNPGGINAGSKCVIYYKYADGGISTNDRPIIKIEGGVFTGSTSSWGTAGIYTIGTAARKCATLNISGGTFNCTINGSGKSKLLVSGGNFNYSVGSQGDSTALRLISGGRFKTLGFMTADSNNTKFWFGTSMGNSNVGLYVDKDGYLCVGGPVITKTSKELPAVASNPTKWSSYLAYSSAATNGLFYEDVDMAIAKHGAANVTIWVKPAVTIPETLTGDVVEEIADNTALDDYTPENLPEGAELEIVLNSVGDKYVYDVTPMANGEEVEPTEAIAFRLPVPASVTETYARVYHEETLMGVYEIKGEGNAKYVEITSADFSVFAVEPITHYEVATYEALIAALANDGAFVIMTADITATATQATGYGKAGIVVDAGDVLDGNGKTLTINGAGATWDCAIAMRGGEVKNLTIAGAMRGVFMPGANGDVVIDNCEFKNVVYTFNSDAGSTDYAVTIKNTKLNGWTSFSNAHQSVTFETCTFGQGSGYAFCRPYQATTFVGCAFNEGYEFDTSKAAENSFAFNDCTYNGEALSAENKEMLNMFYNGGSVVIDGVETNVTSVAKIGNNRYLSLEEAAQVSQTGETITMLADANLSAELTLPANITLDGNGKQINGTIYAGGDLTFVGHTKVTAFSASYYDRVITIGEGACLEITGGGRVSLAYGNTFNITGSIENAKTADKANVQASLIIPAGISITGGNDAVMNVTNAYVQIGNTSSKNSAANGTFTLNFTNSIAEFTNQLTFAEPTNNNTPTFNLNITNSVLTTATKLCVAAPNTNVVVDNSVVTLGTYFRNSGNVTIKNGSAFTGKTIQFGENGGNDGTITVDASDLTITAGSAANAFDGKGTGKVILMNEQSTATLDFIKDMSIETVDNHEIVKENNTYKAKDLTVVENSGTWGGIDWSLTRGGTLTIAPTTGTPVADPNCGKTYEVGAWREAVRYDSKGEGKAIEGWPYDRSKVKTLVIEEGVISIGSFTAQSFTNLTGEVVIPSTVKYIGQEAFQKSTMTKLTFAAGGSEELCIAQGAFKNLIIEEVSLPSDRPVHLHAWVFNNCHNLKNVYMPATIVSVHGTNHIDYFKDFNAHSDPTWTKASEIFAYNENMETVTFGSEEVRDLFYSYDNNTSDKDYIVATVGLTSYCKIADAIAAVNENGGTIKLHGNATLADTWTIPAGKEVTLNLNSKTISQEKTCTASYSMINNKGNLNIVGSGKISFMDTGAGDPNFGWGSYTVCNEGNLVVEKATIEHLGAQAFATHCIMAIYQYSGSTTIDGGKISTPNYRSARLWKGDMTINGGTFDGQVWVQAVDNSAKLTINGGTFSPKGNDASSVFVSNDTYNVALAVTNGTFNGKIGCSDATKLAGAITGGKFNEDAKNGTNTALLATGLAFGDLVNGYYAVEDDPTTHYINNVAELKAFRDEVNSGNTYAGVTVYLAADIDLEEEDWTPITKFNGTFDGQDYTISNLWVTGSGNCGFFKQVADQTEHVTGTVKNVTFENATIVSSDGQAAIIAEARLGARINNVNLTGEVTISGYRGVGGIVGAGFPVIDGCKVEAEGTITATYWGAGGILGFASDKGAKAINSIVTGIGEGLTIHGELGGVGSVTGTPHGAAVDGAAIKDVNITSNNDYYMAYVDASGEVKNANVDNVVVKVKGNVIVGCDAVATIGTKPYFTFADAVSAADNNATINLIWKEGKAPIAMNASLYGKSVTITGTAKVDWSKGWLFVGRGGEGNATLTFDGANLTSASNNTSTGIHVSGREKDTNNKYDGTVVIKNNSTIELDYLINRGTMTLDNNATLTVKNGFGIAGRPASETESGEDATATLTLKNNSKVVVYNHNGMGLGQAANVLEGLGVMNINSGSTFECTQDFLVTANGTMNVNGGVVTTDVKITNVKITNNGVINVSGESTLNIATLTGEEINFLDGAIIKESTVGGAAFVAGNVTFRGDNTFNMLYDYGTLTDYYGTTAPMKWTVEEGASLTLTDKARYGLGYGDNVTIIGSIANALEARENLTENERSLFMHGLVAQESKDWNCNSALIVENAYVVIGNNNSFGNKPGNFGGTYTFNIKNSVVDASRITFYEASSTSTFTFDGSDVKMGTFMTNDEDSKFTLKDSKVLSTTTTNGTDEGNYNAGQLILENSSLTYSATLTNKGTIELDAKSTLTAPAISGAGKITIDAANFVIGGGDVQVVYATTINVDANNINVVNNNYVTAVITETGIVIKENNLEGEGTETNPYIVSSLTELELFRNKVNAGDNYAGKYVKLTANVDLSATRSANNWEPIGTTANPFKGIFDGDNKVISKLVVEGESYVGLFGKTVGATINNVTINNANVKGTSYVGAIVGMGYTGTINNCHVTGTIQIEGNYMVGGISGQGYAIIYNSSVIATANSGSYVKGVHSADNLEGDNVGGIVGHCGENNTLTANTVKNITVSGTRKVGGIVGIANMGTNIDACVVENVTIETTATEEYANDNIKTMSIGALIGQYQNNGSNGTVTNSIVKTVTFNNVNDVTVNVGPITGGTRGTTVVIEPTGVTASNNDIYMSTITGSNNSYLMNAVAEIGGVKYYSLQEAINKVGDGETITLLSDVNVTTPAYGQNALNYSRAINSTIDLNGKILSANTGNSVFRFNITDSGATSDVTVKMMNGTVVAGADTWCAVMAAGISADVKAIFNLEDITINGSKAGDLAVKSWDNAVVNANNVTIETTNGAGGFYAVGGEIVLNNCTVNQKGLHTAPYLSMAFAVSTEGKMTINSGTYSSEPTAAYEGYNQGTSHGSWVGGVMNSGGTLIINGGTFSNDNYGDNSLATAARGLIFADTKGIVEVNGGTFNALKSIFDFQNNLVGGTSPVITVKGGEYNANPKVVTSYGAIVIPEGYVVVENTTNGTWVVKQVYGTQTREFTKGWNWFSSYVNLSTNDPTNNGLEKLETALGTSGIQIKGQTNNQSATYEYLGKDENGNELYGWIGSFTPSMGKMYMVKTSAPVTGQITGDFVPENTAIALNKGWNWISYPLNVEVEINEALKHLEPEEGDVIKMYGSGFAEYYKGKWYPAEGIETLKPGLGYMYKSAKSTSFVYSADEVVTTTSRSDDKAIDYRWTSEASEYAFNMSVIATLNVDGEMMSGGYEIAAFANGECRGSARPIYIERLDQYMLFLTIYGDEVEELTFKCYDVNYGTEYELSNRFNYSSDAVLGSMAEPYMFNMNFLNIEESSLDMINIYPNPTTTDRAINLQATCDNVEVFNALGVKVAEYQNVDTIDALETAGVYVIRVTINGETRNCRLVVK